MTRPSQPICKTFLCNIPLKGKLELKEGRCVFCLNKAFHPEIYPPKEKVEGN